MSHWGILKSFYWTCGLWDDSVGVLYVHIYPSLPLLARLSPGLRTICWDIEVHLYLFFGEEERRSLGSFWLLRTFWPASANIAISCTVGAKRRSLAAFAQGFKKY